MGIVPLRIPRVTDSFRHVQTDRRLTRAIRPKGNSQLPSSCDMSVTCHASDLRRMFDRMPTGSDSFRQMETAQLSRMGSVACVASSSILARAEATEESIKHRKC